MELHGSTLKNLASAIQSARRLRGRTIYADTVSHWEGLLDHARREVATGSTEPVEHLIQELEKEVADRAR